MHAPTPPRPPHLRRATLADLGIRFHHPVAKTGVVAEVGSGVAPIVVLRADMDALPVTVRPQAPAARRCAALRRRCGACRAAAAS